MGLGRPRGLWFRMGWSLQGMGGIHICYPYSPGLLPYSFKQVYNGLLMFIIESSYNPYEAYENQIFKGLRSYLSLGLQGLFGVELEVS